ncbi:microcin C transport system ATP-binding protein [Methylophilus rhizosphaerae]|uniref:Microcin C transport system ATP-binding protein n=1 Tax=Methylophilus rhizosphaerae TaxID=492660 RepID=A0A1G8Z6U1_9PROT|nr:dipeptide ABC transporter ATP-binding protein [Methylophilus rhizosphaerae]SDK10374.1 microcin C transport system ATP-binding protein [Methylophilus rhizosphaerae]
MTQPLLSIEDFSARFEKKTVVEQLNLHINSGERLALVGESGSGKTVTALSILKLVEAAELGGRIIFRGEDLLQKSAREIQRVRGADIAMIFQEPMTALNPLFTIGEQIVETLIAHQALTRAQAKQKALELLTRTGIRQPEKNINSYPHQLSGGQRQRAMIAMALSCKPKLLIADEPTTALDLTIRARIVKLLIDIQEEEVRENGEHAMAILLITHDLNLVRKFAHRVAVMERGRLVETGETKAIFEQPAHPYTLKLINSVPVRNVLPVAGDAKTLLEARQIRVEYPLPRKGWRGLFHAQTFTALHGVDITLREGETVGIVGESGSGKSTLAQAVLNLIKVKSGDIEIAGAPLYSLSARLQREVRARLQVVFQDPFGSLSPRQTIRQIVGEGLELHFPELTPEQRYERMVQVLSEVGLSAQVLDSYPHEFSGGQRQRIAIARAFVLSPQVVVLDEPTSALDVSIQKQVLELLVSLQKKFGMSYLLISHDLTVIQALAHRVYVLKDGEIIESGDTEQVIQAPRHPYTKSLVQASL